MQDEEQRRVRGERLRDARIAAGYRSARSAALDNGWKEATYRSHEKGGRTMGDDDAAVYAARFATKGVRVSAQSLLFGEAQPTKGHATAQSEPQRLTKTQALWLLKLFSAFLTAIDPRLAAEWQSVARSLQPALGAQQFSARDQARLLAEARAQGDVARIRTKR